MKKNIIISIFLLFNVLTVFSQSNTDNSALRDTITVKLKKLASTMKTIDCNFLQTKYIDVFDEEIESKGSFFYKENKIRMDYTTPVKYTMIINGNKLTTVSSGKKSVIDLGDNQIMHNMKGMMTACMIGDLSKLTSEYNVQYNQNTNQYITKIIMSDDQSSKYINSIVIYLSKKTMAVDELHIKESGKDYTKYKFYNRKFNTLKTNEKFKIN